MKARSSRQIGGYLPLLFTVASSGDAHVHSGLQNHSERLRVKWHFDDADKGESLNSLVSCFMLVQPRHW